MPAHEGGVGQVVGLAGGLAQAPQFAQMPVAVFEFLVRHDAVEALLGRLGQEFVGHGNVFFGNKPKAVNDVADLCLGGSSR